MEAFATIPFWRMGVFMLENLYVKNLALIEEADIPLGKGLNILSGETGAGKSIIIGSVNLALGAKVPKGMIRRNAPYAYVELTFSIHDVIKKQLEAYDIFVEEENLVISRKIMANRSISRVNGESVSAATIKEISGMLLDIHGQNEHHSLLYKSKHLEILDLFGKQELEGYRQKVSALYKEYADLKKELEEYQIGEEQRRRNLSFLEFELNEIEEANLAVGEEEELTERYKKLIHGKQIYDGLSEISSELGSDSPSGASEAVSRSLHQMMQISEYDKNLEQIQSMILDLEAMLTDVNREISGYISDMELDEETLYETEKRLDLIHNLERKYGKTIADILAYAKKKQAEYDKLVHFAERKEALQKLLAKKEKELKIFSLKLSAKRKEVSKRLAEILRTSLSDLNFLDVQFDLAFATLDHYTANGIDEVEFVISTNPGEPLKPLGKVASGGELSRIMLAIKTVLADSDDIETLIFDEIDTGISGRTAQKVSEKLSVIGTKHQVICISHLPQIVSMADSHFLISKGVEEGQTTTAISHLEKEESVMEIARLLGGTEITDTTVASAREMKQLAEKIKQQMRE